MKLSLYPRSIYTRFFLIILVPIILLQIITAYIFFERHWELVTKHMQRAAIGEIKLLIKYLKMQGANRDDLNNILNISGVMGLNANYFEGRNMSDIAESKDAVLYQFQNRLKKNIKEEVSVSYIGKSSGIRTKIALEGGLLQVDFSSKKIKSPTTYMFISWVVGSSVLLMIVSLAFLRKQIKPIVQLTQAVELLGKGRETKKLIPCGAVEIRNAALAFNLMKKRIERQIYHRTEMLSHISHDLRTPITRVKLHTEFLKREDKEIAESINSNLDEMEKMITEYLNFAKSEGNEKLSSVDINELIKQIVDGFKDARIKYIGAKDGSVLNLRLYAFKRAITNILNNATQYAKDRVEISITRIPNSFIINIEDDGPGIPLEKRKAALKAFNKLSENREGYGLGLAIAQSVIYAHGGNIYLKSSRFGGLKVEIKLPL